MAGGNSLCRSSLLSPIAVVAAVPLLPTSPRTAAGHLRAMDAERTGKEAVVVPLGAGEAGMDAGLSPHFSWLNVSGVREFASLPLRCAS